MTTLLDEPTRAADAPAGRSRRFKVLAGLFAVVGLAAIGTGIGWIVYAHTYMPLTPGNGPFGSVTPRTLVTLSDGSENTEMWIPGPYRTSGVVDFPVFNNGSHAVKILGMGDSGGLAPHTITLRWGSLTPNAADEVGVPSDSRQLPVTIAPNNEVILEFTITKENSCAPHSRFTIGALPIRWSALGVHHQWDIPLGDQNSTAPLLTVAFCAPHTALKDVSKF